MADTLLMETKGASVNTRWHFNKRFNSLKQEFTSWKPALKELSQYINPTRGSFDNNRPNDGKKIDHRIVIDGHARRAVRTLASGMANGLTSPSTPWFRLTVADPNLAENYNIRTWTDDVQMRMFNVFSRSNIYGVLHSAYEELGTFGTACFFLTEDYTEVIRGCSYTAGEYYLGVDSKGKVNTFARQFQMTAFQMVQEFGYNNCSPSVQIAYRNSSSEGYYTINHLVEPNDDRIPDNPTFQNMPYRSIYWETGPDDGTYLRIGGYEEFPILAPRWDTTTTADAYGRGPGWDSLGDVKMLQKLQRNVLLALDKVTDPPVQVDGSVVGEFNSLPGGVTRFSSTTANSGVKPAYEVNPDVASAENKISRVQQAISDSFYSSLFLMFSNEDRVRTATEISQRQSEKMAQLSPFLERWENELLKLLIERTFNIMNRNGLIPPAPEELQGQELKILYVSILSQAQKMVGLPATDQWVQGVAGTAQLDPDSLDIVEFDAVNRGRADMLGIPQKFMASPEQIQAKREARAQVQQQQQQMAMAQAGAAAAKDGTSALKDVGSTPMDQNTVLDKLLSGLKQ